MRHRILFLAGGAALLAVAAACSGGTTAVPTSPAVQTAISGAGTAAARITPPAISLTPAGTPGR